MNKTLIMGVLVTSLYAVNADAGIMTSNYSLSGPSSERIVDNIEGRFDETNGATNSSSIVLDGFDKSLGTLTQVSISFSSTLITSMVAQSFDTQPEVDQRTCQAFGGSTHTRLYDDFISVISSISSESSAYVSVDGSRIGSVRRQSYSEFLSCSDDLNNSTNNGCRDSDRERYGFSHTFSFGGDGLENLFSDTVLELNLAAYTGVDGVCNSNPEVNCKLTSVLDTWVGSASVEYRYTDVNVTPSTPIPAPGSLFLVFSGLLALAFRHLKTR